MNARLMQNQTPCGAGSDSARGAGVVLQTVVVPLLTVDESGVVPMTPGEALAQGQLIDGAVDDPAVDGVLLVLHVVLSGLEDGEEDQGDLELTHNGSLVGGSLQCVISSRAERYPLRGRALRDERSGPSRSGPCRSRNRSCHRGCTAEEP